VGNIFPLGTKYSKAQKVFYKDKEGGQNPIWFASYGIGATRVMGALAEVFNDDKGLMWPKKVTPYDVYLVSLGQNEKAEKIEKELEEEGFRVLFDDRDVSAGEKFANADLLGFPFRLVVSKKTKDKIELKERSSDDTKLLSLIESIKYMKTK